MVIFGCKPKKKKNQIALVTASYFNKRFCNSVSSITVADKMKNMLVVCVDLTLQRYARAYTDTRGSPMPFINDVNRGRLSDIPLDKYGKKNN